jgi:polysaccharide biosynthesis transport protein
MDSKSTPPPESRLHFLDYWRIIRIRKTVILAVFILVVITATLVTFVLQETYAGTARIRVEHNVSDIDPIGARQFAPGAYDAYFIQTEFEVMQSEVILGRVVTNLDLNVKWGDKFHNGTPLKTTESLDMLRRRVSLSPIRNTILIEIKVYSDNAQEAADLANAIAEAYRDHRKEQASELVKGGIAALESRLAEESLSVSNAQVRVDNLRTTLQISDGDPGSLMPTPTLSVETVRMLQSQFTILKDEEVYQDTQLRKLEELDRPILREAMQTALSTPDPTLTTLINEMDVAEQRLRYLSKDYTEEHPVFQNALKAKEDIDRKINKRIEGILLGLHNRLDATRARLEELNYRFDSARTNDLYVAEKSRPYFEAKRVLAELLQFKAILNMKIASEETDLKLPKTMIVEIIDHATANNEAVRPRKSFNIGIGIVIGLVVGVALAFFIEYLDTSVKTIDDVERTLQAPVLGVIPQNVGFLLEEGAESPHAEAYRVLRTNLLFSRKDDKLNTIAIVSAGAGEGKSTTVINLATVFAQNGNRVIIVDSDLRRPTLHKILQVTNSIGLTNYLLKQNSLEEVIQTTSLPTLDFMASGKLPSSSMGVLSSSQMRNLISELKQRYDFVFFDSPPIMGVSDASILASEVDLTMQVIQYRRYPQPMNIRAKQMIEKVGGNLLGIVLNNINMSQDESYYYYSGYYHEYYAASEDDPAAEGKKKPSA